MVILLSDILADREESVKVFVVYHASKQKWVESYVLNNLMGHPVNLLHTDRVPGENFFNAITRALEARDVKILAVFSLDFESCQYCAFFNENLKSYISQEGKVGCHDRQKMQKFLTGMNMGTHPSAPSMLFEHKFTFLIWQLSRNRQAAVFVSLPVLVFTHNGAFS